MKTRQSKINLNSIVKIYLQTALSSLLVLAFFVVTTTPVSASPQVTFQGTGVGAIPDSPSQEPNCQVPGTPLNISFNVTGLTANVQTVAVTMTFSPAHSFGGDVLATLISPGGTKQLDLFGYTRATVAGESGDGSDLAGPYTFADSATQNWWDAAAAASSTAAIPSGSYRTSQRGGTTAGGTITSLNAIFGGLTSAQANGTWTLRVTDGCAGDTGSVAAASLDITTATANAAVKPYFDFYGTGKSSFAVYNKTAQSNIVWRILSNPVGVRRETVIWGLNSDVLTPGYFDGDNSADVTVYRPSATPGASRYYFRYSAPPNATANLPYGFFASQTVGDFAGYEADYDGDGRDDPAVLRGSGAQWQWIYLASNTNTIRSIPFGIFNGDVNTQDIPLTGADFSGDGRADLIVLRQNASGPETYIWGDSVTGQVLGAFQWGEFNTDFYVLGDFLGDSRFDFAVWRGAGAGANGVWYIRENGGNGFVARQFGIPGASGTRDIAIAGDFGGDSKSDIAVYRPSTNTFYWLNSVTDQNLQVQQFGEFDDKPVGALRVF